MANRHVKKWAISVIKETQFCTMVRILFSLAEGKNIDHTKDATHRNSETADENARFGIILALSHKVGHENSL